jgi:hypothetical protein
MFILESKLWIASQSSLVAQKKKIKKIPILTEAFWYKEQSQKTNQKTKKKTSK